MSEPRSQRSVVKGLLRGEQAARPLLMPLTFSLAARLENLPLGSFATNPTKIVNALRQVCSSLRLDGVTCYFDPFLEVEALGGKLEWTSEGARLLGPVCPRIDELRSQWESPETIVNRGRIPVAADVLKRLRILLKDDAALVIAVTGPIKLATLLAGTPPEDVPPNEMIEFSAEITAAVSKHFVEAGADVVFLRETLPAGDSEAWQWWRALLEPLINVVRFYEALPVLLLDERVSARQTSKLLDESWECVTCLMASLATELSSQGANQGLGVALPTTLFTSSLPGEAAIAFRKLIESVKPLVVTTTMDLPASTDLKQVARLLGEFRQVLSSAV